MGASLGTGNRGVSALGASLVGLLDIAWPEAEPFMLIGSRESRPFELPANGMTKRIPVVNFRNSPRAPVKDQLWWIIFCALAQRCIPIGLLRRTIVNAIPWAKAVVGARFVGEIRGGDSFSDIYGLGRFVLGSLPVLSVILLRGEVVLLPQTYGPYQSAASRSLARFILRRASTILSRDHESLATVENLIGKTARCEFCPDVAFSLAARQPGTLALVPALQGVEGADLIGLNVNGLMFGGGYTRDNMFRLKLDYPRFLKRLAEGLLADPKKHLLLVPHTFAPPERVESDPAACCELRQALPLELQSRIHMVKGEYDQSEIKWVIGMCGFFVGSRMHACIAALSQGIPSVGVAYSKKFKGVFETVGAAGSVIDGRECGVEEAFRRTMDLFKECDTIRPRLETKVKEARAHLCAVFQRLIQQRRRDVAGVCTNFAFQAERCVSNEGTCNG